MSWPGAVTRTFGARSAVTDRPMSRRVPSRPSAVRGTRARYPSASAIASALKRPPPSSVIGISPVTVSSVTRAASAVAMTCSSAACQCFDAQRGRACCVAARPEYAGGATSTATPRNVATALLARRAPASDSASPALPRRLRPRSRARQGRSRRWHRPEARDSDATCAITRRASSKTRAAIAGVATCGLTELSGRQNQVSTRRRTALDEPRHADEIRCGPDGTDRNGHANQNEQLSR